MITVHALCTERERTWARPSQALSQVRWWWSGMASRDPLKTVRTPSVVRFGGGEITGSVLFFFPLLFRKPLRNGYLPPRPVWLLLQAGADVQLLWRSGREKGRSILLSGFPTSTAPKSYHLWHIGWAYKSLLGRIQSNKSLSTPAVLVGLEMQ